MRHMFIFNVLLLCLLNIICPVKVKAEEVFVTIGSGDFSGVYFPTGLAISQMINKKREQYGIRATVESTEGSSFNLNAIRAGYLEFGLAQADHQYRAYNGLNEWAGRGPDQDLRAVFSIYPETVNLVVATDTNIRQITDLKGKKVSLGNPGSNQHRNVLSVLNAAGIDPQEDLTTFEVHHSDAPAWLEDGRIDAYFFAVGHPSESIRRALSSQRRKARLIPIKGPAIDRLIEDNLFYSKTTIPVRQLYPDLPGTTDHVETISVMATLCTSAKVSEEIVFTLVKEFIENIDEFRHYHPAFKHVSRETLFDGISAEFHRGALRYFKEAGLRE